MSCGNVTAGATTFSDNAASDGYGGGVQCALAACAVHHFCVSAAFILRSELHLDDYGPEAALKQATTHRQRPGWVIRSGLKPQHAAVLEPTDSLMSDPALQVHRVPAGLHHGQHVPEQQRHLRRRPVPSVQRVVPRPCAVLQLYREQRHRHQRPRCGPQTEF